MPECVCACGARYRMPESAAGKRARCKKCGQVFAIPRAGAAMPAATAAPEGELLGLLEEAAQASKHAATVGHSALEQTVENASASRPAAVVHDTPALAAVGAARPGSLGAFLKDAAWAFLFIMHPASLVIFLLLWFMIIMKIVLSFAPGCLGLIGSLIIAGWYYSVLLNIITGAAAGEDELPSMRFTEGIVDDIIVPLVQFLGTWLVVLGPAIAYIVMNWEDVSTSDVLRFISGPVAVLRSATSADDPIVWLTGLGIFLWPISILGVALGGLTVAVRIDMALRTIVKTLVPYLLTCALVGGSIAGQAWLAEKVFGTVKFGSAKFSIGQLVLAAILTAGIAVYQDVVAMRIVGFYYHHFKKRFAWGWD